MCNGKALPPFSADLFELRCLEWVTAYHQLNRACHIFRQGNGDTRPLDLALENIRLLEDRCAPFGIHGEPDFREGFCWNLRIQRPGMPTISGSHPHLSSQFTLPQLMELPAAELTGPAKIRRWKTQDAMD